MARRVADEGGELRYLDVEEPKAMITWQAQWDIGIAGIDEQHHRLVKLLNDLHQAMSERRGKEQLGRTIADLVSYTSTHFKAEEGQMRRFGYPEYERHKALHAALIDKADDFSRRFAAGEFVFPGDLLSLIHKWLISHIMSEDRKFAAFLRERAAA